MGRYELISGLEVDSVLKAFVESEVLPDTEMEAGAFWFGFAALLRDLTPENRRLLRKRDELQARIDARNDALAGLIPDPEAEEEFLRDIGYLVDPPAPFTIGTEDVDPEIASIAGPQLVVPVNNARYALNALNARWGSLYDALYGTDILGDRPTGVGYDEERGARVVAWGRRFLDEIAPLTGGTHADVTAYTVRDGQLSTDQGGLVDPSLLAGTRGDSILLLHNGLHAEIVVDRENAIGRSDKAGFADILLESAITAIMDCEDSVATVDAEDKTLAYRNWLGLMKGDLSAEVAKGGSSFTRRLDPDLTVEPSGVVKARSGARVRVRRSPALVKVSARSPFIRPSQLR